MAEFTVTLPGGEVIRKELPEGVSDKDARSAFERDMAKFGISVRQQAVVRPEPKQSPYNAMLTEYRPNVSERVGQFIGDVLTRFGVDERYAAHLTNRFTRALGDLSPVGNIDDFLYGSEFEKQLAILPLPGPAKREVSTALREGIRAYHGGRAFEGGFDLKQAGSGLGYAEEPAVWFTPDKYEANRYAWSVDKGGTYEGKAVYPALINDEGFQQLPPMSYDPEEFARIIAEARKANRPGIIFRSVKEDDRLSRPVDQIAVLDPTRINSPFP